MNGCLFQQISKSNYKSLARALRKIFVPVQQRVWNDRVILSPERSKKFHLSFFPVKALGHLGGKKIPNVIFMCEFLNSIWICMNEITLNVFDFFFTPLMSKTFCSVEECTDQDSSSSSSSSMVSAVSSDVGGPHRRRMVIPDAGQHNYQRLHWSHTQGLERRDRRMYPHPLWAYLNSALHAPTWEKVWSNLITSFII